MLCLEGIVSITLTVLGRLTAEMGAIWCGLSSGPNTTVAIECFLEPLCIWPMLSFGKTDAMLPSPPDDDDVELHVLGCWLTLIIRDKL